MANKKQDKAMAIATPKTTEISEAVAKAQEIISSPMSFNRGAYNFSGSMYDEITDDGKAYIIAFEALDKDDAKSGWQKAYIMTHIYTEYVVEQKRKGEKASKKDLLKFWTGGKQSLYDMLSMGALVKKNKDGELVTPCDKNGEAFDISNFVLIANRKGVTEEIKNGVWLASMSQVQIKAKKRELDSIVVDEPLAEEAEAEEAEAVEAETTETTNATHHEPLEVYLNGKLVDLTAEQTAAILAIIGG